MKKLFLAITFVSIMTVVFHFFHPLIVKNKASDLIEYDGWIGSSISLDPK